MARQPATAQQMSAPQSAFPLSQEFQEMLLRVLLDDREFSAAVAPLVQPAFFSNHVHQWAWHTATAYREKYGAVPSILWVLNAAEQLPADQRPLYLGALGRLRTVQVLDEEALKSTTVDFLRRVLFKKAHLDSRDLWNAGMPDAAYEVMRDAMTRLDGVTLKKSGRAWLAEQYVDRHIMRQDITYEAQVISSGFPELDMVLGGGAYPGFLGLWITYPKAGKTTLLINHGATAMRKQGKKVFHAVLEGNLQYVADRYDTLFLGENYNTVRRGNVNADNYVRAFEEYNRLKGLCVIQDYTSTWDVNISAILSDLKELESVHNWRPDMIILDYVDLLRGRKTNYKSETENQKDAVQDLKKLANAGYAVWSASQVQRPAKGVQDDQHLLRARDIADAYAKVRVADFVGSINQTAEEKAAKRARLFPELFRDGDTSQFPAGFTVHSDFSHMLFCPLPEGENAAAGMPGRQANGAVAAQPKKLGFDSKQVKAKYVQKGMGG